MDLSDLLFGEGYFGNVSQCKVCVVMLSPSFILSGGEEGGWDCRREGGKSCHGGGEEMNLYARDLQMGDLKVIYL